MESNYYREGFENFLKEKSDEYKLYPSEKVWNNINQKLHPRRKWPFLAAALLLMGIGVGTKIMVDDWNSPVMSSFENKTTPVDIYDELKKTKEIPGPTNKKKISNLSIAAINPAPLLNEGKTGIPVSELFAVSTPENLDDKTILPSDGLSSSIQNKNFITSSQESGKIESKVVSLNTSATASEQISNKDQKKVNPGNNSFEIIKTSIGKVRKKTSWQMYMSPTVSYRKLVGESSKSNNSYSGFAYNANLASTTDVNEAVTHKPSVGIELGTAFLYPVSKKFRLKAGLQLNLNNYQVEAYSYNPEIATYAAGNFAQPIKTISYYRNFNGFDRTWLKNSHFMISVPLGVELTVIGNKKVAFNIASTIQPTYVINNQSYLVSTNLKNYAQESSLYRKWNLNAGGEAFISINTGSVKWAVGPQIRYQILSSYIEKYPIKEHLIDYGFKVGVTKILK